MSFFNDEHLNVLVQELSKKNPNVNLIKDKTNLLGIPYNNDLIVMMSEVLVYLSASTKKKPFLKEKQT